MPAYQSIQKFLRVFFWGFSIFSFMGHISPKPNDNLHSDYVVARVPLSILLKFYVKKGQIDYQISAKQIVREMLLRFRVPQPTMSG